MCYIIIVFKKKKKIFTMHYPLPFKSMLHIRYCVEETIYSKILYIVLTCIF